MFPIKFPGKTMLSGLLLFTALSTSSIAMGLDTEEKSAESIEREAAWQRFLEQEDEGTVSTTSSKKIESEVLSSGISNSTIGGLLAVMFGGFGVLTVMGAKGKVPQLSKMLGSRLTSGGELGEEVQVVALRSLGNNNSLAVVEVFEQRLVLGISQGQVSLLTRLDEHGQISETTVDHNTPHKFGQVLGSLMNESVPQQAIETPKPYEAPVPPPHVEAAPRPMAPPIPSKTATAPRNLGNQAINDASFKPLNGQSLDTNGQDLDEVLKAVLEARRGKDMTLPKSNKLPNAYARQGHPVARNMATQNTQSPAKTATQKAASAQNNPFPRKPLARPAWRQTSAQTQRESGAADQVVRRLQSMRRFR